MTSTLGGPWRLLRRRPDLARLVGAALVSLTGDWLLAIGLTYAVYDLTGSTMASAGVFLTRCSRRSLSASWPACSSTAGTGAAR